MASRARGRNCPIIELLEQSGVAPSCHDHLRQDIEQWLAMHRVTLEGAALGGIDELLAYVDGTTPQKMQFAVYYRPTTKISYRRRVYAGGYRPRHTRRRRRREAEAKAPWPR